MSDDIDDYSEDDEEVDDEDYCRVCSGSGEGMHDGTRCHACGGSGTYREKDDLDPDYYRDMDR